MEIRTFSTIHRASARTSGAAEHLRNFLRARRTRRQLSQRGARRGLRPLGVSISERALPVCPGRDRRCDHEDRYGVHHRSLGGRGRGVAGRHSWPTALWGTLAPCFWSPLVGIFGISMDHVKTCRTQGSVSRACWTVYPWLRQNVVARSATRRGEIQRLAQGVADSSVAEVKSMGRWRTSA